jgi:hypothetical protein
MGTDGVISRSARTIFFEFCVHPHYKYNYLPEKFVLDFFKKNDTTKDKLYAIPIHGIKNHNHPFHLTHSGERNC